MALSYIRAGTINSLDESSLQARVCRTFYPALRDQMLQDSPWQFASAVKPLAELDSTFFSWAYVYQYPSDCLYINRIIPSMEEIRQYEPMHYHHAENFNYYPDLYPVIEYKVHSDNGNKVICSNHADLRIDYRTRVTNTNMFSLNFTLALSHLLASEIAVSIAGVELGVPLSRESLAKYQKYLNAGIVNELNEQRAIIPDSEFIGVRR